MLNLILCECLKIVNMSAGNFSIPVFSMEAPKWHGVAPSPARWAGQDQNPSPREPRGFLLGWRMHEREEAFEIERRFNNCNENDF